MRRKEKGDTHSGGGIEDNTTEVRRNSQDTPTELIQRCAFLGSARILRKVLKT